MRTKPALVLAAVLFGAAATTAQPKTTKDGPKTVEAVVFPSGPSPKTPELPPVSPDAAVKLGKDQFYIIKSSIPLVVIATGTGEVTVVERNGKVKPLTIPAQWAVGYPPDPGEPDFPVVTFSDEYLYILKASKSGPVTVQVIPAVNKTQDKEGKQVQVALTRADIAYKRIDVGEQIPPDVVPPAEDPLVLALRAAAAEDPAADRTLLPKLAEFYEAADKTVDALETWVGLFMQMQKDAARLGVGGRLTSTQAAAAVELKKVFPSGQVDPGLKMTAGDKARAKSAFAKLAAAVRKI